MSEVNEKLLSYLHYHSFIKEVAFEDNKIVFSTLIEFNNTELFLKRFKYLKISNKGSKFYIENKELDLLQAAAELEKCLVVH